MTTATAIYFGRPGYQVELPHPRQGVVNTRTRVATSFTAGTGAVRVNRAITGKRQYVLSWEQLWYETFAAIEAFHHGHNGPGPFAIHDPAQRNWLTVNQSSATSHLNAADGFTLSGSGNLSSSASAYYRGPRSLAWDFINFSLGGSGMVTLDAPSPVWPGIPEVPTLQLCLSAKAKLGGSGTGTLTPRLVWLDSTGATLQTNDGTPVALNSAGWQSVSITATPPAGVAFVSCRFLLTGASRGVVAHLDYMQLERGSAISDWRPGTGVPPVSVVSLTERWPWQAEGYMEGPVLTLQEVGP